MAKRQLVGGQVAVQTNIPLDVLEEVEREQAATGESRYAVLRRIVCEWAGRRVKARAEAAVGEPEGA